MEESGVYPKITGATSMPRYTCRRPIRNVEALPFAFVQYD